VLLHVESDEHAHQEGTRCDALAFLQQHISAPLSRPGGPPAKTEGKTLVVRPLKGKAFAVLAKRGSARQ
jgi:hypothetical protein